MTANPNSMKPVETIHSHHTSLARLAGSEYLSIILSSITHP